MSRKQDNEREEIERLCGVSSARERLPMPCDDEHVTAPSSRTVGDFREIRSAQCSFVSTPTTAQSREKG